MSCACENGTQSSTAVGNERGLNLPENDSGGGDGHLIYIGSRQIAKTNEVENGKKKSQQIGTEGLQFAAPLALSVS